VYPVAFLDDHLTTEKWKMSEKIQSHHRDRAAYIYVRQSTGHQVRHNHQGRQRQYDLAALAKELKFAHVVVIDEDQGRTGSGLVERPGFQSLLAAVCGSQVGAVFALEASRLARNNQDWHHLIELCAMTETLIVDADGIYEPRQLNDRLLLGLKGTMSEFELGLFRQRAREAFEMKVKRGHAMWEMPVGLTRDKNDRIRMISNRQVQSAIQGVFQKFRELGSARQVTLWYRDQNIQLPEVVSATRGRKVVWRLPRGHRINHILSNPNYAGALAYGKTEAIMKIEGGRARKSLTRSRKSLDKWKVLILDNHRGYISWKEFLDNQAVLESNLSRRNALSAGVARPGLALLVGLLRCGNCGRKMYVTNPNRKTSKGRYCCHGDRGERGAASCQSLGAMMVDRAVAALLLDAVQPERVRAAVDALDSLERRQDEKCKALDLALEKARHEVDRARRQYDLVDPSNRLVAGKLELTWNASIERVIELEGQVSELDSQTKAVTLDDRIRLLSLDGDLSALWHNPATPVALKKRVLRTVIEEIVIRDDEERRNHLLAVHWKGGVHSEIQVTRNLPGKKGLDTEKTVLDLIEELSKVSNDQGIAATLNRLGYQTGGSKTWRKFSVQNTRTYHRLKNHGNTGEWLTIKSAARELLVRDYVIRWLVLQKLLPATQIVPLAPWIIARDSISLQEVSEALDAARKRAVTHTEKALNKPKSL
jgi:DNA invertase Pin-like site-specific DNA recombinase